MESGGSHCVLNRNRSSSKTLTEIEILLTFWLPMVKGEQNAVLFVPLASNSNLLVPLLSFFPLSQAQHLCFSPLLYVVYVVYV